MRCRKGRRAAASVADRAGGRLLQADRDEIGGDLERSFEEIHADLARRPAS